VFVRKLPDELKADKLHEEFSKFGEIKSLKISLNPDHSSRKYGFICFVNPDSAKAALQSGPYEVIKYAPKDKREFRKAFNNIYVKNFPMTWSEADIR
jgi:polyadenylate-binding protein